VSNKPTLSYEDTKLIVQQYMAKAADRRPQSMIPRKGRYSANATPVMKPPYNASHLNRFEDTFRNDGVAQRAVIKKAFLIMGKYGRIVLDTTEEYDTEEERRAALEKIQNNSTYQDARRQMQKLHVKENIDFHNNVMAAVIQAKTYGRAALEIIGAAGSEPLITRPDLTLTDRPKTAINYNPDIQVPSDYELSESGLQIPDYKLPEALHLCNSKRLGKVEIEQPSREHPNLRNTWKFLGVHYLDIAATGQPGYANDFLSREQIIYFANKDWHISPGALYYGLSDLETVVDGSEAKRIGKQEDIKEIMKSNWAPYLIIKFLNPSITTQQMQEVIDALQPGLPTATKQDVEATVHQMAGEIDKIPNVIDFLNQETIRDMGVPSFIVGYEQIANYANSQQILLALKEIELEAERTWLSNIIERQWLNRYFYKILGLTQDDEPEAKLKYVFTDVTFETTKDKVSFALMLFNAGLISGEKVLKLADMEDEIDEYKLRYEEQQKQKQLELDLQQRRQDTSEMVARNEVSTTVRKRQAQQQKDDVYDKIKEKLEQI
jgi:hypothetical protein